MNAIRAIIAFPLVVLSIVIAAALRGVAVGFRAVSDAFFIASDRANLLRGWL